MKETENFLRKINMHPEQTDIDKTAALIEEEMRRGLEGKSSSLRMLPTFISAEGSAPNDTPVIAIDAGGTNLRVGLVTFKNGVPEMDSFSKTPVPGSCGEISADEFFDAIAEKILPLTKKSSVIGFCFSYPAEVLPNHDGIILQLNKELRVRDGEGRVLGQELIKKLREKGAQGSFRFSLLNDTTAGLMGGLASAPCGDCDGISGLILGTGYNTCYFERGEKIKKIKKAQNMIINCESGCFSGPFRGVADELLDRASAIPGDHLMEKMISGAYMGALVFHTVSLAAGEGLLSAALTELGPFSSMELDDFLRGREGRIKNACANGDGESLAEIMDAAYERAARLVCANIQALCLHCNGGRSAEHPFLLVAEGSTFYNSLLFKKKLDRLLDEHLSSKHGRFVRCLRAQDATMTGTALAALLN